VLGYKERDTYHATPAQTLPDSLERYRRVSFELRISQIGRRDSTLKRGWERDYNKRGLEGLWMDEYSLKQAGRAHNLLK
jgi:hypothetical protein